MNHIPDVTKMVSESYDKWPLLDDDRLNEAVIIVNNHNALVQSLRDMVEIVGANFCSSQDVKRKYKIERELLEQNK